MTIAARHPEDPDPCHASGIVAAPGTKALS